MKTFLSSSYRFILQIALCTGLLLHSFLPASAKFLPYTAENLIEAPQSTQTVLIESLERYDCHHCRKQKAFFKELSQKRSDFSVKLYDISKEDNYKLFTTITEKAGVPKVTPVTIIGNTIISGFESPETTGVVIETLIQNQLGTPTAHNGFEQYLNSTETQTISSSSSAGCNEETGTCGYTPYTPLPVKIPYFGVVDAKQYSLPVLSLLLGFIDGFNPCAMWVLVTFLIILAQVGDKKRMWQMAGIFILAEAIMYYAILNVWYNTWDFVGLDGIVTPLVGILALGGGVFFLYEGITSDGSCQVTNLEQKSKTRAKIKKMVHTPLTLVSFISILGLAFSVNIIEFACSIGIPQAFTKILDLNLLPWYRRETYMGLYILTYMIDDLIVFGIALYSFEHIGLTNKYSKYSNLIGGVLMILLGLIMLYEPSWLTLSP